MPVIYHLLSKIFIGALSHLSLTQTFCLLLYSWQE